MVQLTKISLKNFKSFKRASIPIPEGFTVIVGPNGSGKSNIIDALCFVLGRSSAKSLRADRFSDLIFNGGGNGDSAEFAEVSLYINNSDREIPIDSPEIKITRSIDSEGSSVYRLNGRRTSRTEILDVLSASLIQPDGHNIVLQGDITELIEMSPTERRGIIDGIAGIAEYDEKKRKAVRELEKTNENLSKVEAVLSEIRQQLEKLRREKDEALRHGTLKGEIRKSQGMLIHSRLLKIEKDIDELDGVLKEREKEKERLNEELKTLSAEIDSRKQGLEKIRIEIKNAEETEQITVYKDIEKIKNDIEYNEEKIKNLDDNLEDLNQKLQNNKKEILETHKEVLEYRLKNERLIEEREEVNAKISELKGKVDDVYGNISKEDKVAIEQKDKVLDIRKEIEKEQNKLLEVEKENIILKEKETRKNKSVRDLSNDIKEAQIKLKEFVSLEEEYKKKLSLLNLKIDNVNKSKNIYEKDIIKIENELSNIEKDLSNKIKEFNILNAEKKVFDDISSKKLFFNKAVKEILSLRDSGKKGICGTISELGSVDKKFSKALEMAAGAGLEYIVVEKDSIAEQCILHLKNNKIGRATFLPLNRLKTIATGHEATKVAKNSYGFALDLIEFNKKFEKAFAHVFSDTVVVEDIEFARSAGIGKTRMVTLDGDLIERSGRMSGGYYRKNTLAFETAETSEKLGILEKEIKELEKTKMTLSAKLKDLKQKIERGVIDGVEIEKERNVVTEKIKSWVNGIEEINEDIDEKKSLLDNCKSELKDISKTIKRNEIKIKEIKNVINNLKDEQNDLNKILEKSKYENILKNIKDFENKISLMKKERDDKNNQIILNESKINEILKPKILELGKDIANTFFSRKESLSQLEDHKKKVQDIKEMLKLTQDKREDVSKELKELRKKRELFEEGTAKINNRMEEIRKEIYTIVGEVQNVRVERARMETKLEDVKDSLKDFKDMNFEIKKPVNIEALERKIVKMENEMEALEPINMRAIEDFKVVEDKFNNLKDRSEKLTNEQQAINKLMEEIEHRKISIFMGVFENIDKNFMRIFSQLSGGEANLLLDKENPLEGGLDIEARPAGKNPRLLESLSGGEKTITALSFLFAIQRYQPAPFYILDEIDMFLDEKNAKRVSELIRESSKEAQFVVVSLKDTLMTSADHLFGISSEMGISKMIGVELEEVGS